MLRLIEKSESHLIQKITTPKGGLIAYQVVPKSSIGDSSQITRYERLFEARNAAGIPTTNTAKAAAEALFKS